MEQQVTGQRVPYIFHFTLLSTFTSLIVFGLFFPMKAATYVCTFCKHMLSRKKNMQKLHLDINKPYLHTETSFYINSIIYAIKTKLGHLNSCLFIFFANLFFPSPLNESKQCCQPDVYPPHLALWSCHHIKPALPWRGGIRSQMWWSRRSKEKEAGNPNEASQLCPFVAGIN